MDTARIFFLPNAIDVKTVRAVTLESDLRNVGILAEKWDHERAFLQVPSHLRGLLDKTREKVIRAAQRHDEGKRNRFRIERISRNGRDYYAYSYRGHRFDVTDPDLYVELLIRLHHNAYSVRDINDAIARLRLEPEYQEIAKVFPLDSYTVQMCDQIMAEVEIYALDNENPRKPEFMEFKTEMIDEERIAIEPYPFRDNEITVAVDYVDIPIPENMDLNPDKLTKLVRNYKPDTIQTKEVTLCPRQ